MFQKFTSLFEVSAIPYLTYYLQAPSVQRHRRYSHLYGVPCKWSRSKGTYIFCITSMLRLTHFHANSYKYHQSVIAVAQESLEFPTATLIQKCTYRDEYKRAFLTANHLKYYTYNFLQQEALATLAEELYNTSDTRYNLAIYNKKRHIKITPN